MNNLDKRSESGIDRIVSFCKKNVKYMSKGFLTVALVMALAVTVAGCKGGDDNKSKNRRQNRMDSNQMHRQTREKTKKLREIKKIKKIRPRIQILKMPRFRSYSPHIIIPMLRGIWTSFLK